MKKHVWMTLLFLWALGASADEHISIAFPDSWVAQSLSEYVGQTVVFDDPMVVCNNAGPALVVSPRRLFEATNQAAPRTPEYASTLRANSTGYVNLNGVSGYHRCGEKIYNLRAKVKSSTSLTFISGTFRGNTRAELEAGLPDLGDYDLLVCGFNIENYFVRNLGSEFLGANSEYEHQKQRAKVSAALRKINADLFGFAELEDGTAALEEIIADLNKSLPARHYVYAAGVRQEGSNQMVDFVYDENVLEPIGKIQRNQAGTNDNRKKMICFREKATGEKFIYAINHFKAKSGNGTGGDANQGDGQGAFNATRVMEAQSVIEEYKRYYPDIKESDILLMGDLNAFGKEDPVTRLTSNGFIDLHRAFHADSSYSYRQRNGIYAGYLDHALCNNTMYGQITGMAGYHINSDETDDYSYKNSSDKSMFRCSDHDPILVGLKLDSTLVFNPDLSINSLEVMSRSGEDLTISNGWKEGQHSYYAVYDISGRPVISRQEITSVMQPVALPLQPGVYILYIYYDSKIYQHKFIVR